MKTKIITLLAHSTSVRMVRRFAPVFAFCGAIGVLAGCAGEPESHAMTAPNRSVTATTQIPDTMFPAGFENPTNTPDVTP